MHKLIRYIVWCILLVICIYGGVWLFNRRFMQTSDTMSLSYSPSAAIYLNENYFYVHDNVLYFRNDSYGGKDVIKYVKNNVIRTFAKIPGGCDQFIIIDEKTAIVQWMDALHLLNTSDDSLVELWQGNCVGYYDGQVYFTDDTTLYAAEIGESEPDIVLSFDELLASDYNGITYKNGVNIYQYLLEQPNAPKLLTVGEIPWLENGPAFLLNDIYLYASDYALHVGSNALDMYIYKTGEMRRIYDIEDDDNMVAMAVVARENELYVSRQYMDWMLWLLKDKEINGTYKYDIRENIWTKVTDKTYTVLAQFDEQYLYGYDSYGVIDRVKRFKVD